MEGGVKKHLASSPRSKSMFLVVPDLTDRTPIGRSGTPDLNRPDHDQADLLPTPPLRNLAGSARSLLPDQPRLPQIFFIIADQAEMPHRQKSQEKSYLGTWSRPYQKVSETCSILPVQVSKVEMKPTDADPPPPDHGSHCGLEGRSPLPDHTSQSPRRSGQANDAPIRGQLSPCLPSATRF